MKEKISIDRCRKLTANNQAYTDTQIEHMRDTLYVLAGLVIDKVKAMKDAVFARFQTISCKGNIVK